MVRRGLLVASHGRPGRPKTTSRDVVLFSRTVQLLSCLRAPVSQSSTPQSLKAVAEALKRWIQVAGSNYAKAASLHFRFCVPTGLPNQAGLLRS